MDFDDREEGVRVGAAKYGLGVYATRSYPADVVIGQVEGDVVDDPDYTSDYCIDLVGDCSLEPSAPFRYMNHSCDPNCVLVQCEIEDDGIVVDVEIWVEALRPISENEQLTIDYAWPASGAIRCGCESENCRGWVVCEDELDQLPLVEDDDIADEEEVRVNAA